VGYFQARNCLIAFNTVVDSQGPYLELAAGLGASGRTLPPEGITVANNLFSLPAGGQLLKGNEERGYRWVGNLASPGAPEHAGIKSSELKLAQAPGDMWRPGTESPARGNAEGVFPTVTTDIEGQPRRAGCDVGCDQISTAPVTARILTATDVGPAWRRSEEPSAAK
jgi:poly(beta-D-mannuronate) lyase